MTFHLNYPEIEFGEYILSGDKKKIQLPDAATADTDPHHHDIGVRISSVTAPGMVLGASSKKSMRFESAYQA